MAEGIPSKWHPNYVTFSYPDWRVVQTAPSTEGNNPVWRIVDPEHNYVRLAFPRLEDAIVHLWLVTQELMSRIDAASAALEDVDRTLRHG